MVKASTDLKKNQTIEVWLLCLFAATLPLPTRINNSVLVLLGIYWIYSGQYRSVVANINRFMLIRVFILVFIVIIISAITSETKLSGFSDIEKFLYLLLPVILSSFSLTRKSVNIVLRFFVFSCSLCASYSIISTFFIYDLTFTDIRSNMEIFSYYSWVLPNSLNLPSNHYSLFVAFALIILLDQISGYKKLIKISLIILAGFLFGFMALLSSRISFFALVLVVMFYLVRSVLYKRSNIFKYVTLFILFMAAVLLLLQVPYLKSRMLLLTEGMQGDARYGIFKCGVEIFLNNPLWGVGMLDAESEAVNCYEQNNLEEAISNRYNFHNTFLEIAASTGITGLLLFVSQLVILFLKALKEKGIANLGFAFLFTMGSLTESLLSRSKGIVFFAFFSTLLFIIRSNEENTSR